MRFQATVLVVAELCAWGAAAGTVWAQDANSARTEYIRVGGQVVATISTPPRDFQDSAFTQPDYAPLADAAALMAARGITLGCAVGPPKLYCADLPLTRGAMGVFIIRAWSIRRWGSAEAFLTQSPPWPTPFFGDVPLGHAQFAYVQKMFELGISMGCVATPLTYCVDDPVTTIQAAIFSVRARNAVEKLCESNPSPNASDHTCTQTIDYPIDGSVYFADFGAYLSGVPNDNFKYAQWAIRFGAVSPARNIPTCTLGNFCANTPIVRAQMSTFVTRMILNEAGY